MSITAHPRTYAAVQAPTKPAFAADPADTPRVVGNHRAIGSQRSRATPQHAAVRPGNPARTAEPARAQPGGAGLR
jgi:hypothetical protein